MDKERPTSSNNSCARLSDFYGKGVPRTSKQSCKLNDTFLLWLRHPVTLMQRSPQSRSAAQTFKDEPVHHECHVTVLVHSEASRYVDDLRGPWALRGDDRVANEGNALSLL
jgi:hypothetical protein